MSSIRAFLHEPERVKAEQFRRSLVESIAIHSSALRQAFLVVPREAFVPFFYERDITSKKMAWIRIAPEQISPESYLALLYRDEPLVTQLDKRSWPISSSSMPSAMARMLEALDVQSGHRVLEIGTGTGYNAALLAQLTGNPRLVTTVEVDAVLAERAAEALNDIIGPGIAVQVSDGFAGYSERAPYDRIIATASAPVPPRPWIEQLAPGGRLVMDMQGSLASGFLVLQKHTDNQGASGRFLAQPLYFMPLITDETHMTQLQTTYHQLLLQPCSELFLVDNGDPFPGVLKENAFRWLLQWRIPGCKIREESQSMRDTGSQTKSFFVIDSASQTILRFRSIAGGGWHGSVHGDHPLWHGLRQVYEDWQNLGQPGQERYHLELDANAHPVLLIGSLRLPIQV